MQRSSIGGEMLTVQFHQEKGVHLTHVTIEEYPGFVLHAHTIIEAMEKLPRALKSWKARK